MIAGAGFVLWQKRAGILAMVLLVAALLSLVDALVGGFMGGQRLIELIPDSRYAISGPMPPKTEAIKDFIIEGQQPNGSTRLVPEAIYSGYLFGGSMWRGAIVVDPAAREGSYEFKVKDRFGEKQNPTLVFKVKVWPDQATLNAHSKSLLIRLTGRKPFFVAFGLALGGFLTAGVNFILGRLWARHLAAHQCGEIYRVRNTKQGKEITCEIQCAFAVRPDMPCKIYRPSGELLCDAHISGCDNNEVLMLVDEPELVRMGDVACILSPPTESVGMADQETQAD
jgi:hypothetical protein